VVIDLPRDAQKLVAFLALQTHQLRRTVVAGGLWADSSQERAIGNLRSALWRVRQQSRSLITSERDALGIGREVRVDVAHVNRIATRLFDQNRAVREDDLSIEPFALELLPGWYEDWVLIERERVRQQAAHALETIVDLLAGLRRYPEAVEAALASIRLDPLRESAHRCLIRIHIGEGNRSEALRQYIHYRSLLDRELGLSPSNEMLGLIEGIRDGPQSSANKA
jgi:DNA-binding SARP family transcriptional activator